MSDRHTDNADGQILSLIHRVSGAVWDFIDCCSIVLLVLAILLAILSGIRCN
jgi:hypothetical protein